MKQGPSPLLWIVTAIVLSALTSLFVSRIASPGSDHGHAGSNVDTGLSFHDWLHAELKITPEQEKSLASVEASFEKQRIILLGSIRSAGQNLATTLEETPEDAASINAHLAAINSAQGELQRVTIDHFLEMKRHLSPPQAALLLQWTRESITHDHRY